jgi:hypothetical protein
VPATVSSARPWSIVSAIRVAKTSKPGRFTRSPIYPARLADTRRDQISWLSHLAEFC